MTNLSIEQSEGPVSLGRVIGTQSTFCVISLQDGGAVFVVWHKYGRHIMFDVVGAASDGVMALEEIKKHFTPEIPEAVGG